MTNKEAIEAINANYPPENYTILREALDMAITLLEEQETIVRCKNCIHWAPCKGSIICGTCKQGHLRGAHWFCADGERK